MKKLAAHLQYSYWIYLLIALLPTIIWVTVFQNLAAPDSNEKVSILFLGSKLDSNGLEEALLNRIDSLTKQNISQISVEMVDTTNLEMVVLLLSTRVYDTDLIILSEELLQENFCQTFFPPIPMEQMNKINDRVQYYFEDALPYGILIAGGETDNRFASFYSGDKKYYVFFSSHSVNLGRMFSKGEYEDDAALAVLKYLLES